MEQFVICLFAMQVGIDFCKKYCLIYIAFGDARGERLAKLELSTAHCEKNQWLVFVGVTIILKP